MTIMAKRHLYRTQRTYTTVEENATQRAALQLREALEVLVLTPHIREYLEAHDPQGLAQARKALQLATLTRAEAVQLDIEATREERAAAAAAAGTGPGVGSCTCCGLASTRTPDGRLYGWPDGQRLCWECNDKRLRLQEAQRPPR